MIDWCARTAPPSSPFFKIGYLARESVGCVTCSTLAASVMFFLAGHSKKITQRSQLIASFVHNGEPHSVRFVSPSYKLYTPAS